MSELHELRPAPGSTSRSKRKGRGPGSGKGKTAGRGENGQKSRSGGSIRPGFEGGQMPLQRRIPKRGFTQRNRTVYQIVNVGDLGRVEGFTVNALVLKEAGLIRSSKGLVKILATGELDGSYSVEAHKFSGGAVAKIEAAGGSTTVLKTGGSDSRKKGSKLQKKRGVEEVAAAAEAPSAETDETDG
jgi:large subunit ribosomal protein L15